MTAFGVRRLVIINSGNYEFANIDLTKPVHLAAPNNRGKSTLVNALQFLYIDDFAKMRFGHRSHEDTRRHYFSSDRSYLVFECLTASGVQCMLVRSLGSLRGGQFERYVYDGEFQQSDYLQDSGEIRAFEEVRTGLADRGLIPMKSGDLWQALSNALTSDNGKAVPHLNILPIRRREEYTAFRDVFVRLLSLTNVNARALRELIIESHAREVGERKIDVAAEYKEEFERVERSERHLAFIQAVSGEIESGRTLRLEARALREKAATAAVPMEIDVQRCRNFLDADETAFSESLLKLRQDEVDAQSKKEQLLIQRGVSQAAVTDAERNWNTLQDDHKKWSTYSQEFVVEIRDNESRLAAQVAEQTKLLDQAGRLDIQAMRRRAIELKRQIATDRKAVEQWERTAVAVLRRAGVSEDRIAAAFRVANPQLLKLVVGEKLTIKDLDLVLDRVGAIAAQVRNDVFSDDAIEADLSECPRDEQAVLGDLTDLQKRIQLEEQELQEQEARLQVAEDQQAARSRLDSLKRKHEAIRRELTEYDAYASAWAGRSQIESQLKKAKQDETEVSQGLTECERQLTAVAKLRKETEGKRGALTTARDALKQAAKEFQQELQRQSLEPGTVPEEDRVPDETARPKSVLRFAESICNKLGKLAADLLRIDGIRTEMQRLQDVIAGKSSGFETQQRYFSDADAEWESLIESFESLPQLETAAVKSWDALSTTLGARMNAVVTAVSSIRNAVDRLNKGLKAYQVSNLRTVQIELIVEHDTFAAVEALSAQGSLFQDRDAVEIAKKRLRRMIDRNETIDLEALFELRIHIQQMDGSWKQAASLDEIGSTGTGMTVKAMIFIQLVRAIAVDERYRLHFYIDGLGELDDNNLSATAAMAVARGVIPITADPRLHLEPLAHPEVTVYGLGQHDEGRFFVDNYKTYRARRRLQPVGDVRE